MPGNAPGRAHKEALDRGLIPQEGLPLGMSNADIPKISSEDTDAAVQPLPETPPKQPGEVQPLGPIAKAMRPELKAPEMEKGKLVSERINELVTTKNPILESAQTTAIQQMNARGLISSTMASQAAQQAVLETATGIAKADAEVDMQNRKANFDAQMEQYRNDLKQQQIDDDRADALQGEYRTSTNNINSWYDQQVAQIQVLPDAQMDAETKQRMIADIESRRAVSLENNTALYQAAPSWDSDWEIAVNPEGFEFDGSPIPKTYKTDEDWTKDYYRARVAPENLTAQERAGLEKYTNDKYQEYKEQADISALKFQELVQYIAANPVDNWRTNIDRSRRVIAAQKEAEMYAQWRDSWKQRQDELNAKLGGGA